MSRLISSLLVMCLCLIQAPAQTYPKRTVKLYHTFTTQNGVTRTGTGKAVTYYEYESVADFLDGLEQFGLDNAGFMVPTSNKMTFKDANNPDITYFSVMRFDKDRIAVTYRGITRVFTMSGPDRNNASSGSVSTLRSSTVTNGNNAVTESRLVSPSSNQNRLQSVTIPYELKKRLDAEDWLSARAYVYNNNNFSFPIYGVKITTTYEGRSKTEVPSDMTCYMVGNDDIIVIISEKYTGVFLLDRKNLEGYDAYYSYFNSHPKSKSKQYLYVGAGANNHKILMKLEDKTSSGKTSKTHAEWTTTQSASRSRPSNGSGMMSPSMSSVSSPGTSSSSTSSRRICPACKGTGKGSDRKVYRPDYTGKQANVYCSVCGTTGAPHTHNAPMCRTCYGRGYIE